MCVCVSRFSSRRTDKLIICAISDLCCTSRGILKKIETLFHFRESVGTLFANPPASFVMPLTPFWKMWLGTRNECV